jgi:hypothetical protein
MASSNYLHLVHRVFCECTRAKKTVSSSTQRKQSSVPFHSTKHNNNMTVFEHVRLSESISQLVWPSFLHMLRISMVHECSELMTYTCTSNFYFGTKVSSRNFTTQISNSMLIGFMEHNPWKALSTSTFMQPEFSISCSQKSSFPVPVVSHVISAN